MTYDAIVVGAGPAGSTAARLLALRGASVLLLDKRAFPRDKPCGGGITLRAASVQDVDLSPVVERTIYGAQFSLRMGPAFNRRYSGPLAYMTQRSHLDAYLAERAAETGASFHDGEAVREIEMPAGARPASNRGGSAEPAGPSGPDLHADEGRASPLREGVTIRTERDTHTARILIGADGANGITGRALGLRDCFEEAVALEAHVPFACDIPEQWREQVGLDLGGLAGGYGWGFPKGDHLNIGVGGWKYAGFTLKPKLAGLCRHYGFDPESLDDPRAHHLPLRMGRSPIARGPAALVGDAAGLVDPLTGEGIHMAFVSGRLAAESALACLAGETPDMTAYQRAVDRCLQPELDVSHQLQEIFHFAPPPYLALMRRSDKFWRLFCRVVRGETTYLDFMRMIGPLRHAVALLGASARRRRLRKVESGRRLLAQSRG